MRKQGKHPEWTIPDAGEAQKDIVTKNKPQSKKIRDSLTEPDHTPEQHAPGKEPGVGHPNVADTSGESYKDINTKEAYTMGFVDACNQRGIDPDSLAKEAGLKSVMKALSYASKPNPGKIKLPKRVLQEISSKGVDLKGVLDNPSFMRKVVVSTPKKNRQYTLKLIKKIRRGEDIMESMR